MLPATTMRVPLHTSPDVNAQIRCRTEANICYFGAQGIDGIDRRLRDLDREWDIERWLETLASSLTLVGLLMSLRRGRAWLLLPLAVQSFFLQHALQGWCPPLTVLRRLGIRTATEIDHERCALKVLRGNFLEAVTRHAPDTATVQ